MTTDPLRPKALACVREGRVTVLGVRCDSAWNPRVVLARVRSSRDGHPYRVWFRLGHWTCDCRDGRRGDECAHVRAVALVTTGASA